MTREQLLAFGLGTYGEPRKLERGPWTGHWAHAAQMLATCAVMITSDGHGNPMVRWCYATRREASAALAAWDGTGEHPPGDWIKQKGRDAHGHLVDRSRVPGPHDD